MRAEVKFCGMTRGEDVRAAVRLGAAYVGVIFAGGPRHLTPAQADSILREATTGVGRVGVFADQSATEIGEIAERLRLTVVQLHAASDSRRVADVRRRFHGSVWSVVRVSGGELPSDLSSLFADSDAVLIDSKVAGKLGGTGAVVGWGEIAPAISAARMGGVGRLVLAGGLRPENVAVAIETLHPDVVDVSSGIEASPGIKDHSRMRLFMEAVDRARVPR